MSVATTVPLMRLPPGIDQRADHAVSRQSELLRRLVSRVEEHLSLPLSVGLERHLRERLAEVALATSAPNWDGYSASPVKREAILDAELFIRVLPRSVRLPDIVPEPAGDLGFEWRGRERGGVVVLGAGGG